MDTVYSNRNIGVIEKLDNYVVKCRVKNFDPESVKNGNVCGAFYRVLLMQVYGPGILKLRTNQVTYSKTVGG